MNWLNKVALQCMRTVHIQEEKHDNLSYYSVYTATNMKKYTVKFLM